MANVHGFGSGGEKKDDEGKRNELYTGGIGQGGGGSGMAVLGPPDGAGGKKDDVFSNLVKAAQENATLANMPSAEDGPGYNSEPGRATITLYQNGFTIDDGPLRDLASPENQAFLEQLLGGRVPRELRDPNNQGAPMEISLSDKRGEAYRPPTPPSYIAFSNGTTLGGTSSSSDSFTSSELEAIVAPVLDDSAPLTQIQVKTSDGKKMRMKVNMNITVLQLAASIREMQNGSGPDAFTLAAGFPPKELTDKNMTVETAGLKNTSITQKAV